MMGYLWGRVFPLAIGGFKVLLPNTIHPRWAEPRFLSLIPEPCVHIDTAGSVKSAGTGSLWVLRIVNELGLSFILRWLIPQTTSMMTVGYKLRVAKSKSLHCAVTQSYQKVFWTPRSTYRNQEDKYLTALTTDISEGYIGKDLGQSCGFGISSNSHKHT